MSLTALLSLQISVVTADSHWAQTHRPLSDQAQVSGARTVAMESDKDIISMAADTHFYQYFTVSD